MRHLVLLLLLVGCDARQKSQTAGQVSSIALELISPAPDALGVPPAPPIDISSATFTLRALDDHGNVWPADLDIDVYISFGGVKTGAETTCGAVANSTTPITTIHLTAGVAENQTVQLPKAFGPTSIWLDEPKSHATGASPVIYFRNPHIDEVQTPPDLTAPNATFCSSFSGKYVLIDSATNGGQLVVTSVFGDAFSVTDTGTPEFNSIYIYSFGKPPLDIVPGRVIQDLSGNVSKFVGFTELNFPLFNADDTGPLAAVPSPSPVSHTSIQAGDEIGLLRYDAGVVVASGRICDPNPPNPANDPNIQNTISQWEKFDTFVLDGDTTCSSLSNFAVELPAKVLGGFDPLVEKGKMATVVGMLKNNSGQNNELDANGMTISCDASTPCAAGTCIDGLCKKGAFNFWTILPRSVDDITVQ